MKEFTGLLIPHKNYHATGPEECKWVCLYSNFWMHSFILYPTTWSICVGVILCHLVDSAWALSLGSLVWFSVSSGENFVSFASLLKKKGPVIIELPTQSGALWFTPGNAHSIRLTWLISALLWTVILSWKHKIKFYAIYHWQNHTESRYDSSQDYLASVTMSCRMWGLFLQQSKAISQNVCA